MSAWLYCAHFCTLYYDLLQYDECIFIYKIVALRLLLCSLISGSNKDGFVQRALNASRAYTDIINSVLEAETAAKKANESATEALEVQSMHAQQFILIALKT